MMTPFLVAAFWGASVGVLAARSWPAKSNALFWLFLLLSVVLGLFIK